MECERFAEGCLYRKSPAAPAHAEVSTSAVVPGYALLACPFCGGDAEYHNGWIYGDRAKGDKKSRNPSVTCQKCGIGFSVGSFGGGISDNQAHRMTANAWNKRA